MSQEEWAYGILHRVLQHESQEIPENYAVFYPDPAKEEGDMDLADRVKALEEKVAALEEHLARRLDLAEEHPTEQVPAKEETK